MYEDTFEERVELARALLERSPLSGLTPGAAFATALAALHAEDILGLQMDLIDCAYEEQWAWDALAAMAQVALRNSRETMPSILANWTADVLAGNCPRPKTGKKKFAQRDLVIAEAICLLTYVARMKPTRRLEQNRRKITKCCAEGGSACDAVGVAMGMNYKTVERIWYEWRSYAIKRLKPTGRGDAISRWFSTGSSAIFKIKSDQSSRNSRQLPGNNLENRNDRHRPPAAPL